VEVELFFVDGSIGWYCIVSFEFVFGIVFIVYDKGVEGGLLDWDDWFVE